MTRTLHHRRPAAGLGGSRRAPITGDQRTLVTTRPLSSSAQIPVLVAPKVPGLSLVEWSKGNADYISELLSEHRALLFRGFKDVSAQEFSDFVEATSNGERLEYKDRTTPRTNKGDRIYTSTVHPADQTIDPHNEGTYWNFWPAKLYLACMIAPDVGGATPIGDVRRVLANIPLSIRRKFIERHWMLVRNFNDGFGLPWQEVFQTSSKADVEEYCKLHNIRYEWKSRDRLRTSQVRPAIRKHPVTGESVWFNHAAFFHYTSLEESMRNALLSEFGEDGLPYNTYYGDGTEIEPETADILRQAYKREMISFPWQRGDVVILDNMSMYHARESYKGDREVLVAMAEKISTDSQIN